MIGRSMKLGRTAAFALVFLLTTVGLGQAMDIKQVTSPGGIKAWLIEDRTNPVIALDFMIQAGSSVDPAGKEGRARLLSTLLDEGAGEYDALAFQTILENQSISLGFSAGYDSFSGSLFTLTENRETAFELLSLSLNKPRFDAEPVERMRSQALAGLRARANRPNTIAGKTWWKSAFDGHAYGRPSRGSEESLTAVTVEDLRQFMAKGLSRDGLIVSAVGDISAEELGKVVDQVFGALPEKSGYHLPGDVKPGNPGETYIVKRPVPQSVVVFGHRGIAREDKDWYAASILFEVMAGGFGSRLSDEIREKRGLAYSVYAYPAPLKHAAMTMGGVATANERVAESISVLRAEWARMAESGPTEDEVKDAKSFLVGSFVRNLTDSPKIADLLTAIQHRDLGPDYIAQRPDLINAVTMADLKRVAKRLFLPEELTLVVVGDPVGLKASKEVQ